MHFFIKTCTALVPSGSIDFLTAEWLKQLRAKACNFSFFFFPPVTLSNFISRETVISHCSDQFVSSSLLSDCPADVVLQHCCWRRGNSQKMVICYYKKKKKEKLNQSELLSLLAFTAAQSPPNVRGCCQIPSPLRIISAFPFHACRIPVGLNCVSVKKPLNGLKMKSPPKTWQRKKWITNGQRVVEMEAERLPGTRLVIPGGISEGDIVFWRALHTWAPSLAGYERDGAFPLASLMTDFLDAVLHEMASSLPSLAFANPHPGLSWSQGFKLRANTQEKKRKRLNALWHSATVRKISLKDKYRLG